MAEELEKGIDAIQITSTSDSESATNGFDDEWYPKWGFQLAELYKLALTFYKEKEGKAYHLTYQDKLKLVAYTKQVSHGQYKAELMPDVGFLDVVGNDRRQAWQNLQNLSQKEAMGDFVKLLDSVCPLLEPWVEAHRKEQEEIARKRRLEEEARLKLELEEAERQKAEQLVQQAQEEQRQRQYQHEMQIRSALNQQTAIQFRQYAEQQCPGNAEQQEALIGQLQEQHFQQYMQQVYQQQLAHQQQQQQQLQAMQTPQQTDAVQVPTENGEASGDLLPPNEDNGIDANGLPTIAAASMWTRKDICEFKTAVKKESELQKNLDSIIKVGSGETVTVRVPTHEEGTCLFWEFATDSYDLGFGVYFEWTVSPSNTVTVQVSDSSDDELEDDEASGGKQDGDPEKGSKESEDTGPPVDEIIPVYRRDCQEEVYCGSHVYPGRGVYLLKFDNSYSLWRSKTLYYRVYYTR